MTTASAELNVNAGGSLHYGDSATTYVANLSGATLGFTVEDGAQTEALTAGAINYSNTYIVASDKFTVGTAGNATLTAPTANSSTLVTVIGGDAVTSISASLTGAFENGNNLNLSDKVYTAKGDANLDIFTIDSVAASSGNFDAQGDFTGGNTTIDDKVVKVSADTDITVTFDATGITALNNLTDGITVNDAANATKALTDSTGTFKFAAHSQDFTVNNDEGVTFQLNDNGLVTGIAGIDASTDTPVEIHIVDPEDTSYDSTITVTDTGIVLTRNDNGTWSAGDVVAVQYLVEVTDTTTVAVYAIDENGNKTKIDSNKLGTLSGTSLNLNSNISVTDTSILIANYSSDTAAAVNVTGAGVNVRGISKTDGAVEIDSTDANVFNVGSLVDTTFTAGNTFTVSGGIFTAGDKSITVSANNAAVINAAGVDIGLKDDGTFTVDDGPAVTIATGADDDSTTANVYKTQLNGTTLEGLKPSGVETGTVKLDSTTDTVTFKINDASVSVTNDNDRDGITLEIKDNELYGLNNYRHRYRYRTYQK